MADNEGAFKGLTKADMAEPFWLNRHLHTIYEELEKVSSQVGQGYLTEEQATALYGPDALRNALTKRRWQNQPVQPLPSTAVTPPSIPPPPEPVLDATDTNPDRMMVIEDATSYKFQGSWVFPENDIYVADRAYVAVMGIKIVEGVEAGTESEVGRGNAKFVTQWYARPMAEDEVWRLYLRSVNSNGQQSARSTTYFECTVHKQAATGAEGIPPVSVPTGTSPYITLETSGSDYTLSGSFHVNIADANFPYFMEMRVIGKYVYGGVEQDYEVYYCPVKADSSGNGAWKTGTFQLPKAASAHIHFYYYSVNHRGERAAADVLCPLQVTLPQDPGSTAVPVAAVTGAHLLAGTEPERSQWPTGWQSNPNYTYDPQVKVNPKQFVGMAFEYTPPNDANLAGVDVYLDKNDGFGYQFKFYYPYTATLPADQIISDAFWDDRPMANSTWKIALTTRGKDGYTTKPDEGATGSIISGISVTKYQERLFPAIVGTPTQIPSHNDVTGEQVIGISITWTRPAADINGVDVWLRRGTGEYVDCGLFLALNAVGQNENATIYKTRPLTANESWEIVLAPRSTLYGKGLSSDVATDNSNKVTLTVTKLGSAAGSGTGSSITVGALSYYKNDDGIWYVTAKVTGVNTSTDPNWWYNSLRVQVLDRITMQPVAGVLGENRVWTDQDGAGKTWVVAMDWICKSTWTYRLTLYAMSQKRVETKVTDAFAGGTDHYDIVPTTQVGGLDLRRADLGSFSTDEFKLDPATGKFMMNSISADKMLTGTLRVGYYFPGGTPRPGQIAVYGHYPNGTEKMVMWAGVNGNYEGLWASNFWAGGTSPADAPFYIDNNGDVIMGNNSTRQCKIALSSTLYHTTTTVDASTGFKSVYSAVGSSVQTGQLDSGWLVLSQTQTVDSNGYDSRYYASGFSLASTSYATGLASGAMYFELKSGGAGAWARLELYDDYNVLTHHIRASSVLGRFADLYSLRIRGTTIFAESGSVSMPQSLVTNLVTDLSNKAAATHTHSGYAPLSHQHAGTDLTWAKLRYFNSAYTDAQVRAALNDQEFALQWDGNAFYVVVKSLPNCFRTLVTWWG